MQARCETYRQRALRILREAAPLDPAATSLRKLIDGISFFTANPGTSPERTDHES